MRVAHLGESLGGAVESDVWFKFIAPCAGTVLSIAVKVGDAVEPGQVLVSIG